MSLLHTLKVLENFKEQTIYATAVAKFPNEIHHPLKWPFTTCGSRIHTSRSSADATVFMHCANTCMIYRRRSWHFWWYACAVKEFLYNLKSKRSWYGLIPLLTVLVERLSLVLCGHQVWLISFEPDEFYLQSEALMPRLTGYWSGLSSRPKTKFTISMRTVAKVSFLLKSSETSCVQNQYRKAMSVKRHHCSCIWGFSVDGL